MSREFGSDGTNALLIVDKPNTLRAQSVADEGDLTSDRNDRGRDPLGAISLSLSSSCLPLPNLTKPGDVDAPYYENWAREYCGGSASPELDSHTLTSHPKIPEYEHSR